MPPRALKTSPLIYERELRYGKNSACSLSHGRIPLINIHQAAITKEKIASMRPHKEIVKPDHIILFI